MAWWSVRALGWSRRALLHESCEDSPISKFQNSRLRACALVFLIILFVFFPYSFVTPGFLAREVYKFISFRMNS